MNDKGALFFKHLNGKRLIKSFDLPQGWTSNSMIDRLYKRNIDPLAVADMNKFYDDRAPSGK